MAIIMTIFFITVFIIIVSGYQTIAVGLIIRNKGRGDGYQDY